MGPLLCPAFSSEVKLLLINHVLFIPFFGVAIVNWLLSLHLASSECNMFTKNINVLIKRLLNQSTQTIFQGGTPSAWLILNSMSVVWVLYCVQFFSLRWLCSSLINELFSCLWSSCCTLLSLHLASSECNIFTKHQFPCQKAIKTKHPNNFSMGYPISMIDPQ